jgi:hypothetical protein
MVIQNNDWGKALKEAVMVTVTLASLDGQITRNRSTSAKNIHHNLLISSNDHQFRQRS